MSESEPLTVLGIPVVVDQRLPPNVALLLAPRARQVEAIAEWQGVPPCLLEHDWTPWSYTADREAWRRTCRREGCPGWEAQAARLGYPNRR